MIAAREFLRPLQVIFVGMCRTVIHLDSPRLESVPTRSNHLSPTTLRCHFPESGNPVLGSVIGRYWIARFRGDNMAASLHQNQNEICAMQPNYHSFN
jgi:hypothetical protein